MMVRRFFAGVLLAALAVPTLAAAPRGAEPKAPPQVIAGMGTRVFARADGTMVAQATPAPTAPPTVPPSATPSPTAASLAAARAEYEAWRTGKVDRSHYTAYANSQLTDALVTQVSGDLTRIGAIVDVTQTKRVQPQPGVTMYTYRVRTATVPVDMLLVVVPDGKYAGISFNPVP